MKNYKYMLYRNYKPKEDEKAASRIMRECGWPNPEKNKKTLNAFREFIAAGRAHVAEYQGEAESLVTTHQGTMRMLDKPLELCAVTGVCVSHVLRQTQTAGELTSLAIMEAAKESSMAALGIFDQGFYDKFGFGCFPYVNSLSVDPITLQVPRLERRPVRLGVDNLKPILRNFERRRPNHGQVHLPLPGQIHAEMIFCENGFGVGFEDAMGEISHHMWIKPEGKENGPYVVHWMVFEDLKGFVELLSFMRSLADQVNTFTFQEPWGVQVQDFLLRPFRTRETASKGKHKNRMLAESWQQARILDMAKVMLALRIPRGELQFRADISDPIEAYLPEDAAWRGVGGSWIVNLSEKGCSAERCSAEKNSLGLQVLKASVNAFTRLVFGVLPASGLAVVDNFEGDAGLIDKLDKLILLPRPVMDMDF